MKGCEYCRYNSDGWCVWHDIKTPKKTCEFIEYKKHKKGEK